ncbi:MAG: HAD-IC family P-type ATPase, partial [Flammeovirgaceae bacterium]|nr:HAD-IC family P-type ATPase [Flammeovirgaceae bacterium]MDW8287361.1 HAD-IC family P-type ATPase [Flammeovirgaceae bacterium]
QKKRESKSFQTVLSQYFTVVLLSIAMLSALYWGIVVSDWSRAINAFSAVLIIACPCALALSSPFALGTAMRMLGRWKFYLKNAHVVEELAKATSFVFDKTGTITEHHFARLKFVGKLSEEEKRLIKSVVKNSLHPLSMAIVQQLVNVKIYEVTDFHEIPGKGVIGKVQNRILRIGAESFVKQTSELPSRETTVTTVHVQIDDDYKGYFEFANTYREGIAEMILQLLLLKNYSLHVLSGDNDREKDNLRLFFGEETILRFHQSPHDKREYVAALQEKGERVVMLGDGLNDAGALQQSQVGVAVTENTAFFTPAADVIMEASVLKYLPRFVRFCQQTMSVLKWSFVISLVYNIIGLFFAVQGTLSPLIAAILMPISSITIIAFTTLTVSGLTKNWNKN